MKHLRLTSPVRTGSRLAGHMRLGNPYGYPGYRTPFWRNPVGAIRENIVHPISLDGLYTLLGAGLGAVGTTFIPKLLLGDRYNGMLWKIGGNVATMTLLATLTKLLTKRTDVAKNIIAGGLTVTAIQLLYGVATKVPVVAKVTSGISMAGLGASQAELLKSRIEEQVRKELGQPKAESAFRIGQPKAEMIYRTGVGEYAENEF